LNKAARLAVVLLAVQSVMQLYNGWNMPVVRPGLGDLYFKAALWPPDKALGQIATLGYPLFLRLVGVFSSSFEAIPFAHTLVLVACVFLFWWGACRFGMHPWPAAAAASVLLWKTPVQDAMTETLATILSVGMFGAVFWAGAGRARALPMALLGALVCVTYQVRPGFLFSIGVAPLACAVLSLRKWGWWDRGLWARHSAWCAGVCVLPLLLFCALRLAIVGHFGLMSFAGQNSVGITVELLDEEVIAQLPPDHRPLAMALHHARENWPTPRLWGPRFQVSETGEIMTQFTVNVNRVTRVTMAKFTRDNPAFTNVEADRYLSELSSNVIRSAPLGYLGWCCVALWHCAQLAREARFGISDWGPIPDNFRLLAALLAGLGIATLRGGVRRRAFGEDSTWRQRFLPSHVLFVVFLLYFGANVVLISAIMAPIPRYVENTMLFIPAWALVYFVERMVILFAAWVREPGVMHWWMGTLPSTPADVAGAAAEAPSPKRRRLRWTRRRMAAAALAFAIICGWIFRHALLFWGIEHAPGTTRSAMSVFPFLIAIQQPGGVRPLHAAALAGDAQMIRFLLDKGASVSATTRRGMTPLHCAAMANAPEIVDVLLEAGAEPGAAGPFGLSPLHLASLFGNRESIASLLERGADIDVQTGSGIAPLHLSYDPETAAALLSHGANIEIRDRTNATPLHWAWRRDILTLLLERGADINAKEQWASIIRGCTLLHKAVYPLTADIEEVRWLLEHGADPNATDINGMTPLYFAIWRDHVAIAELLLAHRANVNQAARWASLSTGVKEKRYTEIYVKTTGTPPGRFKFDELVPDRVTLTPFQWAFYLGRRLFMAGVLIEYGATIDARNEVGMTALHWAILSDRTDGVEMMLDLYPPEGMTEADIALAVRLARILNYQNCLSLLERAGVAVSDR
jgi:ankyrin repeat protein